MNQAHIDPLETEFLAKKDCHPTVDSKREKVWEYPGPLHESSRNKSGFSIDSAYVSNLAQKISDYTVAVCAMESTSMDAIAAVSESCIEAGVPCIHVNVGKSGVRIGPTVIPGVSTCLQCSISDESIGRLGVSNHDGVSIRLSHLDGGISDELLREQVAVRIVKEIRAVLADGKEIPLRYVDAVEYLPRGRVGTVVTSIETITPDKVCSHCAALASYPHRGTLGLMASTSIAVRSHFPYRDGLSFTEKLPISGEKDGRLSIGVIGGGTAGNLTALYLSRKLRHTDITLVESPDIPIIGVGEATTPPIVSFLHEKLGFDCREFYDCVRPTWKLGIKFHWGKPGSYYFNYPFDQFYALESLSIDKDVTSCSMLSMMMSADLSTVLESDRNANAYHSILEMFGYAYHLDNAPFVEYLQGKICEEEVSRIKATVVDVIVSDDGGSVNELVCSDGQRLKFDLLIDCSGFRSMLLEKAMGSKFVDYKSSLMTDTAVIGKVPNHGKLKPYTYAETMESGWCWNIPQREEDHRGYVFASHFCSVEEATREMARRNPGLSATKVINFRSGRHEHFWKGNVIGMGNAYAFVEPLESTAIHMVLWQIELLGDTLSAIEPQNIGLVREGINLKVNQQWDYLRWFLAIHYRYNKKLSTEFWRECNRSVDVSGLQYVLDLYLEHGPLNYCSPRMKEMLTSQFVHDELFGLGGIDILLMGQGVIPKNLSRFRVNNALWRQKRNSWNRLLQKALPQEKALRAIMENTALMPNYQPTA